MEIHAKHVDEPTVNGKRLWIDLSPSSVHEWCVAGLEPSDQSLRQDETELRPDVDDNEHQVMECFLGDSSFMIKLSISGSHCFNLGARFRWSSGRPCPFGSPYRVGRGGLIGLGGLGGWRTVHC